jgi:multidrug efflux system outer membrane protein
MSRHPRPNGRARFGLAPSSDSGVKIDSSPNDSGVKIDSGVVRVALAACTLLAAAGCALKSPPDQAEIAARAFTAAKAPPQWTATGAAAGTMSDNWLAGFNDAQLSALVADAIYHNADLRVGAARVEQALLYAKLAGATLYPSVDLVAKGGGKMSGDGTGLQGAVLNASWELDLWGRVRYGRAAARADALAAAADFEYARQSIAALVARSWFLAIEAGLQAEIARAALRDNQALVRLAEDRARIGVGNEEDVFVARSGLGTYEDALRQIELSREQAIRALEILAGRYPAAALSIAASLPTAPETMPAGLPSELLERRPDVIAAERRVAAAFNRIGEAKAARLPRISLTTGVSSISSDLFVLNDRDNPIWNLGASLLAPLYKGGALKTQVEIRTVEQKQAIAAYAGVGLRAFGEVENALSAELAARDRERILTRTLSDSQRALEIVQSQFQVGSTDLRFVTQRQLALNSTQSGLVRAQVEQRVQRVNLHLALGGSFDDRSQPAAPAPATPPPATTDGADSARR